MTYREALENRRKCLEYLKGQKGVDPDSFEAVRLSVEALERLVDAENEQGSDAD